MVQCWEKWERIFNQWEILLGMKLKSNDFIVYPRFISNIMISNFRNKIEYRKYRCYICLTKRQEGNIGENKIN